MILVALMMEVLRSSVTLVRTGATLQIISEDGIHEAVKMFDLVLVKSHVA
jgi:hypothetical protein